MTEYEILMSEIEGMILNMKKIVLSIKDKTVKNELFRRVEDTEHNWNYSKRNVLTINKLLEIREKVKKRLNYIEGYAIKRQNIEQKRDALIQIILTLSDKQTQFKKLVESGNVSFEVQQNYKETSLKCVNLMKMVYDGKFDYTLDNPDVVFEEIRNLSNELDKCLKSAEQELEIERFPKDTSRIDDSSKNFENVAVEERDDEISVSENSENSEEINSDYKHEKQQTLRKKFDINNEDDFDNLLAYYAQANKEYYSGDGKKKSEEEIKKRKNMNAQFKRILQNKAKQMPQNEDGEEFSATITSIEKGEVFNYSELKEVAENKGATLRLFNIMASGVYEKDGKKIRLTQKQRVALASTLEIISGMRLDMDKNKKKNKTTQTSAQEKVNDIALGDA